MKIRYILFALLITGTFANLMAQSSWNWPEDKATAEEKNALYTDLMKQDNYLEAAKNLRWLMENAPDLNPSIYINGAKIYESLVDIESDDKRQLAYQDTALTMYDKRIKYFGEEAYVLNRKAFTAYKYYKDRKDNLKDLIDLMERSFELNGPEVLDNNLVAYMDAIRRYKVYFPDNMTDLEVLERYEVIMDVVDAKIASGKNVDRLERNKDTIDKLLTASVNVDCDFIDNNLGPKLESNPKDLKMAKKIFQLMITGKCTDSPLFITAASVIQKVEPTYGVAKVIGLKSKGNEDYDAALKYFEEAAGLTDDNAKKSDAFMEISDIYGKRNQKARSREWALKALNADATKKNQVYTHIGYLYFNSFNECKEGVSKVEDRAIFIAAYEMFKRAGYSAGMQSAKAQFPSIEEIFELNFKEGDQIDVGCWVNETVSLQRRP